MRPTNEERKSSLIERLKVRAKETQGLRAELARTIDARAISSQFVNVWLLLRHTLAHEALEHLMEHEVALLSQAKPAELDGVIALEISRLLHIVMNLHPWTDEGVGVLQNEYYKMRASVYADILQLLYSELSGHHWPDVELFPVAVLAMLSDALEDSKREEEEA